MSTRFCWGRLSVLWRVFRQENTIIRDITNVQQALPVRIVMMFRHFDSRVVDMPDAGVQAAFPRNRDNPVGDIANTVYFVKLVEDAVLAGRG